MGFLYLIKRIWAYLFPVDSTLEIEPFIMHGGSFSFCDWRKLSVEQQKIALRAYAARVDMSNLQLAGLVVADPEQQYYIAQALGKYDGGELEKIMRIIEAQKAGL